MLSEFAGAAAGLSSEPLKALLKAEAADELVQDVIVDFEKDRVKEIAKSMTEPLSDALYRSKRPPQTVEFRVERALAESRPRLESLPTTILAPTVEDRIQEKFIAVQFKRAAEQARRR